MPERTAHAALVNFGTEKSHNSSLVASTSSVVIDLPASSDAVETAAANVSVPSRAEVRAWLRRTNPTKYGGESGSSIEQDAYLCDAEEGIVQLMAMKAKSSSTGLLQSIDCPLLFSDEDPRNMWSLEGRFSCATRKVDLSLAGMSVLIEQRWRQPNVDGHPGGGGDLEGHSTAAVCWTARSCSPTYCAISLQCCYPSH